jgi:hypothetical protein
VDRFFLRDVFVVVAREIPESCRVRIDLTGAEVDFVYTVEEEAMDETLWRARCIGGRKYSERYRE